MTLESVKSNILQLSWDDQAALMQFMIEHLIKTPKTASREDELVYLIKFGGPKKGLYVRQEELLQKSVRGEMTLAENEELQELNPIFDR